MHFLWDTEIRGYGDTGIRRYAGGLLKESPEPPELFSNCIWLKPGGGMRRPAGACPGQHGQVNSGSPNPAEAAKPILQHPTSQPPCRSVGEGRNRARTPDPINHNLFGKVLGGLGDSFKSPPNPPELFSNCIWLKPGGGMRRPAGACPGRHGQVNSGSPNPAEAAKPILQHPTSQPPCRSVGEGRNRARTPDPINHNLFGKVLGGLGDS